MTGCEQQTASYRWQYDYDNMQTDEQFSVTASRHFSCTLRTHANRGTNGRLVTSSNLSLVTVAFHDAIAKLSSLGWLSTRGRQDLKRKATGGMGDQQHRPRPWGGEVKECEDWLAPLVADLETAMWQVTTAANCVDSRLQCTVWGQVPSIRSGLEPLWCWAWWAGLSNTEAAHHYRDKKS